MNFFLMLLACAGCGGVGALAVWLLVELLEWMDLDFTARTAIMALVAILSGIGFLTNSSTMVSSLTLGSGLLSVEVMVIYWACI
jgi:hypothetical protein